MYENSGEAGGKDYPQGGQTDRFPQNRPGRRNIGAETAVKHDKDQADGTDVLGNRIIVKLYADRPVCAEEHTQADKDKQRWDGKAFRKTSQKDTDHDHNPD